MTSKEPSTSTSDHDGGDGTRRRGRRRKSDVTREALKDQALKLFAERGFTNTTIDDITRSLGVSRPSLYFYFENKDALFAEIVNDMNRGFLERFLPILDDVEGAPLPVLLRRAADLTLDYYAGNHLFLHALMRGANPSITTDTLREGVSAQLNEVVGRRLITWHARGRGCEVEDPTILAGAMSAAWFRIILHYLHLVESGQTAAARDRCAAAMVRVVLGILEGAVLPLDSIDPR